MMSWSEFYTVVLITTPYYRIFLYLVVLYNEILILWYWYWCSHCNKWCYSNCNYNSFIVALDHMGCPKINMIPKVLNHGLLGHFYSIIDVHGSVCNWVLKLVPNWLLVQTVLIVTGGISKIICERRSQWER